MAVSVVSWTSVPYAVALGLTLVVYFLVYPFVVYIRDPKGM